MRIFYYGFIMFMASVLLGACKDTENNNVNVDTSAVPADEVKILGYKIVNTIPHDTNSFTEGLYMHDNKFYESTGATQELPQSRSLFGELNTQTGKIKTQVELDRKKYFGEGITQLGDKIYQLTYQTKIGFVYDAKTLKQIKTFTIPSAEGWGFTNDGTNLIMSDGTSKLSFLDANTLAVVNQITVTENNYEINNVNELEYVDGFIYANVFTTNNIIKIDARTGKVVAKLDASAISNDAKNNYSGSLEMNGIAYNPATKNFYITGKMWPRVYEVQMY